MAESVRAPLTTRCSCACAFLSHIACALLSHTYQAATERTSEIPLFPPIRSVQVSLVMSFVCGCVYWYGVWLCPVVCTVGVGLYVHTVHGCV